MYNMVGLQVYNNNESHPATTTAKATAASDELPHPKKISIGPMRIRMPPLHWAEPDEAKATNAPHRGRASLIFDRQVY